MTNIRKNIGVYLAVTFFLIISSTQAFAIGPKIVKGQILDNHNNPISGATVLLGVDGRYIGGVVTDLDGRFVLQFESGDSLE
jgi:hypothetical protein